MINYNFLLCNGLIFIFFLLILLIQIFSITKPDDFSKQNIYIVNPTDAYNTIINNGYINTFNNTDMKIRKCKNIEDCKNLYKKNFIHFTKNEKQVLVDLVKQTNKKLKFFTKLYNLPWKFTKTTNKIDNGFPHTHNDTIYLSDGFFKNNNIKTLIHEKIHLYQKKYPYKTDKLYKLYNYEKIERLNTSNRRANPDLNNYDYKHNGKILYSEYNDNADNLSDIKMNNLEENAFKNEHPDEYFAYLITDKIIGTFDENDQKIIDYITY
tara:strand:- start:4906 stop:5703 length:798 start_codon:yes stop_codon:yes gene_type:complete